VVVACELGRWSNCCWLVHGYTIGHTLVVPLVDGLGPL
jgi:hypothetical protein